MSERLPPDVEDDLADLHAAGDEPSPDKIAQWCEAHPAHARLIRRTVAALFAFSPALPKSIGPYHIVRKLGEGGMGVVYLAAQREPVRRDVALKVIRVGADSSAVVARFKREQQMLACMQHGGIAQVYDCGMTSEGSPYFTMEYVEGEPLTRYCDRRRLSLPARLALFLKVCSAVTHAHEKGVVHRDLKPSNILTTERGGEGQIKVIDFGLAKTIGDEVPGDFTTRTGAFLGTPEYMAPEQAAGAGLDIDTRADVYSLGVTLYELLTGCLPIDPQELRQPYLADLRWVVRDKDPPTPSSRASRLGDLATKVATDRATNPVELARRLRGDLDGIVMRAIHYDRAVRYSSVRALAEDIERHLAHRPVLARPPGALRHVGKWLRRRRWPVAATLGVALAFVAGSLLSGLSEPALASRLDSSDQLATAGAWPSRADQEMLEADRQAYVELLHVVEHEGLLQTATRADVQAWLARAEGLQRKLPEYRARLAAIAREAQTDTTLPTAWDGPYELVSTTARGLPATSALAPALSADGRFVVFESNDALTPDDQDDASDVFVLDRSTERIERVSRGATPDQSSEKPSISGDGRIVAWATRTPEDGTLRRWYAADGRRTDHDIFICDRKTGDVWCASTDWRTGKPAGLSFFPRVSADGRLVVFESLARLAKDHENDKSQIYVHDVARRSTSMLLAGRGISPDGNSDWAWPSHDGRLVSFSSEATNLVEGDRNGQVDVFVHDRSTGLTRRVSVGLDGQESDGESRDAVLSADGRHLAFRSEATNLVAGDNNGLADIFVCELDTGRCERVSIATDGTENDGASLRCALSGDGQRVLFLSHGHRLAATPLLEQRRVYLHDRASATTICVSASATRDYPRRTAAGDATPAIAADGQCVAFGASLTGHAAAVAVLDLLGMGGDTVLHITQGVDGKPANGASEVRAMTPDGRLVLLDSDAANLVAGDRNQQRDVFLRDAAAATTVRISLARDGSEPNGRSTGGDLSANGRTIVFTSHASNLVPGDDNELEDVFLRVTTESAGSRLTRLAGPAGYGGVYPQLSADGCVALLSRRPAEAPQRRPAGALCILDLTLGQEQQLLGTSYGWAPQLADDGRSCIFSAAKQVSERIWGPAMALVRRADGSIVSCNQSAGLLATQPADSFGHDISGDGRVASFTQKRTALVPEDTNTCEDVYVLELERGRLLLASVTPSGCAGNGPSEFGMLSPCGRFVTFLSKATDLVPDDHNGSWDVFVRDLQLGRTIRASVDLLGREVNAALPGSLGGLYMSYLSAKAQYACFDTDSAALVGAQGQFESMQVVRRSLVDLWERDARRARREALPLLLLPPNVQRPYEDLARLVAGVEELAVAGTGPIALARQRLVALK